jgi:hypothetical protein
MPVLCLDEYRRLRALLDAGLLERVAALEAQVRGEGAPQQPEPLRQRNASLQANAARLHAEIERILAEHRGPRRLSAKRVLQALADTDIGRAEQPSIRTIQWHIAQLRNAAVLRSQ